MWHRLTLTTDDILQGAEFEILDLIDAGVRDNWQTSVQIMTGLRNRGHTGAIPLQRIPVEIHSTGFSRDDRIRIYMNDAALEIYRKKGGRRQVEETVETLPGGSEPSLMRQVIFRFDGP